MDDKTLIVSDHGGGNPRELYLDGTHNTYVDGVSTTDLTLGGHSNSIVVFFVVHFGTIEWICLPSNV